MLLSEIEAIKKFKNKQENDYLHFYYDSGNGTSYLADIFSTFD